MKATPEQVKELTSKGFTYTDASSGIENFHTYAEFGVYKYIHDTKQGWWWFSSYDAFDGIIYFDDPISCYVHAELCNWGAS